MTPRTMFWKQPALPWETCDRCNKKASLRVSITQQSEPREGDWSLRCHDHTPKDETRNEWRRKIDLDIDKLLEPFGLF